MKSFAFITLMTLAAITAKAQEDNEAKDMETFNRLRKLQVAEFAINRLYVDSLDEDKLVDDAIVGMLGGVFLGLALTVLLAGTAFFEGVSLPKGYLARHSRLVHVAATVMASRLEGPST